MGLLDIVGSFAGAGANILSRQNKEAEELETRKQLADHQAKLEAQKLDTIERLKEERLRKQQDELVAADDKATTRAKELGTARRMDDFKAKLGQTDATEAELQEAFKQYDNKAVQAGDKTDTQFMDKRRADAAGDYVKAARETGNTGLLSQAKQGMDAAMKQDAEEAKAVREERKADQRDDKLLAAIGGGKGSGKDQTLTAQLSYLDNARKAVDSERTALRRTMEGELKDELDPTKKAGIRKSYEEQFKALDVKTTELHEDYKFVKSKLFGGPSSAASGELIPEPKKSEKPASYGAAGAVVGKDEKGQPVVAPRQTATSKADFIGKYSKLAEEVGARIGVNPDFLLAQWGHEVGWGKSGIVAATNNLGNVTATSGQPYVEAKDNMNGKPYRFVRYDSPEAFGNAYIKLMSGNRYKDVVGTGDDADKFSTALGASGYAEDKGYSSKLRAAIDEVRSIKSGEKFNGMKIVSDDVKPATGEGVETVSGQSESGLLASAGMRDLPKDEEKPAPKAEPAKKAEPKEPHKFHDADRSSRVLGQVFEDASDLIDWVAKPRGGPIYYTEENVKKLRKGS